jgi:DNA sulfur modification protein DndD
MKKYEGVATLIEKRRALQSDRDTRRAELATKRARVTDRIRETATFLCRLPIDVVYRQIDGRRARGEIPSEIRAELIESLIEDGGCICGRQIAKDSPEHKSLLRWLHRVGDSERNDFALELWRDLGALRGKEDTARSSANTVLTDYATDRNFLQKMGEDIEEITATIGEDQREDLSHLARQQKDIATALVNFAARKLQVTEDLASVEERLRELEREKDREEKEKGRKTAIQRRHSLAK